MSSLRKRTATKNEMRQIQQALENGIPMRVVAKELNIYEECILNFVPRQQRARIQAREILDKKEAEKKRKEQEREKELAAKLLEEETEKQEKVELMTLKNKSGRNIEEEGRLKELMDKYEKAK